MIIKLLGVFSGSPVLKLHTPNLWGPGLIPGQRTRILYAAKKMENPAKTSCAATKTWHSQINKILKISHARQEKEFALFLRRKQQDWALHQRRKDQKRLIRITIEVLNNHHFSIQQVLCARITLILAAAL